MVKIKCSYCKRSARRNWPHGYNAKPRGKIRHKDNCRFAKKKKRNLIAEGLFFHPY